VDNSETVEDENDVYENDDTYDSGAVQRIQYPGDKVSKIRLM